MGQASSLRPKDATVFGSLEYRYLVRSSFAVRSYLYATGKKSRHRERGGGELLSSYRVLHTPARVDPYNAVRTSVARMLVQARIRCSKKKNENLDRSLQ